MDVHSSTPPRRVFSPDEPVTLVDVFTGIARNHKRPDTLNYKSDGRWVSVSSDELLARAKRIAAGLHAIGVHRGDRVALLSESRVEWTLTDSGACVLFLPNREKFIELKDALGECPQVKHVIFFEAVGVTSGEGMTLA